MFITKNSKSKYYQIVFTIDGKKTTRSTKTNNKKEAQKILYELQNSFPAQVTEKISIPEKKNSQSLSEFKKEYLEYHTPLKTKKYLESINLSFNQFISFSGDIPLKEISVQVIDKFISATFARTKRGAHHYYRTLKAAFNKALEWNYIESNLFTKVKFPKLTIVYPVFITENELLIILSNTQYQHLKDIIIVAFYTGMRLGELINMRWSWINFSNNQITVKCSEEFTTKNKKERIIPINDKVRSIFTTRNQNSIHQLDEVVFYRVKGKKLYLGTISKQFKDIVHKSNLDQRIHFHSLRHSFASVLAQKGVSLYVIKELLGHEDLATTQVYSHLYHDNLKDAINLL